MRRDAVVGVGVLGWVLSSSACAGNPVEAETYGQSGETSAASAPS